MANVFTNSVVSAIALHLEALRPLELAVAERHERPSVVCHTLFTGIPSRQFVSILTESLDHFTRLIQAIPVVSSGRIVSNLGV